MNRAQPPQRLRTAGGDDRTTYTALEARGAIRPHHTATQRAVTTPMGVPSHRVHNPVNPGKPACVGEALRTQGKGGSPTYSISAAVGQADGVRKAETPKGTCGRVSSAKPQAPEEEHGTRWKIKHRTKDTANPTDRAPPQEQDRQLEPERLRNPLRVTCGRTRRGKPQALQEEAQKPTPTRGASKAYPAHSRRRERRHSSAASGRTYTHTQGQPVRRSTAQNRKASHRRRRPKRTIVRRS